MEPKKPKFYLYIGVLASIILLAVIVFLYSDYLSTKKQALILEQKKEIINGVYSTEPISKEEKEMIFGLIGNNKIHDYGYTAEEKYKLIEAYNKK